MSHRAIQRLRKEREPELLQEEESEDEEDDGKAAGPSTAFSAMLYDDDSDDSDDDSSSDSDQEEDDIKNLKDCNSAKEKHEQYAENKEPKPAQSENVAEQTEDLDTLLEEFKIQDKETVDVNTPEEVKASWFDVITSGIEARDLDIDYVMRTSLLGSNEDSAPRSSRRGRQTSVFGPPRDEWPRPPHYVGGGMGMTSYDNESWSLPWPYSDMKEGDDRCPSLDRWFKFIYSDSYKRDCEDYERIKASGDPNSLALFIAHHPFVVEPLLQLSSVLYQTNQSQEGLSLLKRALWVYECSSLNSFLKVERRVGFMDMSKENELFSSALFRLVRVCHVAGLPRASLAVSKFLLSLDPLRDPMNILLALDHFTLLSNTQNNDEWLVDFVESGKVSVFYQDEGSDSGGYECELLGLPNWSYSYALALYRINENQPSPDSEEKANIAIKTALSRFPSIVEQLLVKNEVNTSGRSFQTDWPSILGYATDRAKEVLSALSGAASDPVVRACTSQAYETIARIFVHQNFKLWSSDSVLKWVYRNLHELKESENKESIISLSPAIMRYTRCDLSDYDDKFQTLPAEANPLDPALVAHALNVDPNRPRFVQRMQRGGGGFGEEADFGAGNFQGEILAGAPTQMVDPDWPLLEVFWRSALPWAHVEGVPPPPR